MNEHHEKQPQFVDLIFFIVNSFQWLMNVLKATNVALNQRLHYLFI
jgi:hypothetical protein